MDDTLRIIAVWVHILGIALFVGPQFFLAFAWAPAARGISDQRVRLDLTRTMTRKFGWIGGIGLLLILLAGGYLISSWRDYYGYPDEAGFTDIWYGVFFIIKMTLLIVLLAVTALHMFIVGPRLVSAMDEHLNGTGSEDDVRAARKLSMAVSGIGLLLVLVIMVFGVMMNTTGISFEEV